MDIAQFLTSQWEVVSKAPLPFILAALTSAVATAKVMKSYFSSEAAAAKVSADHFKQLLSESEKDKNALLGKLQIHGEDIESLKRELATRPRIFIQDEEPKDTKPFDVWVKP